MNFDQSFAKLIGHEGGYVNNPADPGGETKYGISKRSYPHLAIASLTKYDASVIYHRDFWNAAHCDSLPDEVRFDVFDGAVNSGVSQSAKWLQGAVGAVQDGSIGPKTIAAARAIPGATVAARFNGQRLKFMTDLKTWDSFGKGWARRIAKNLMEA
jgi:lysozyme family protein